MKLQSFILYCLMEHPTMKTLLFFEVASKPLTSSASFTCNLSVAALTWINLEFDERSISYITVKHRGQPHSYFQNHGLLLLQFPLFNFVEWLFLGIKVYFAENRLRTCFLSHHNHKICVNFIIFQLAYHDTQTFWLIKMEIKFVTSN